MECEAAHFGATVVRALVFARGASEVLSEICRPVRRQGVARYQHGGLQIPPQTRFGLIDTVVNVDRLRPYKQRPPDLGPSEEDAQPEALIVDPRGGTWWEVEDVVAHRWCKGQRKFLVRYKGFGPSFDEWKQEEDVSEQLVKDYDELCRLFCAQDLVTAATPAPTSSRAPASTPSEPDPSRRIQAQRRDRDERAARRRR